MNARELNLYRKANGTCAVKLDGEESPRDFIHLLQALEFVHRRPEFEGATLTVYDKLGNATLKCDVGTLPTPSKN